MTNKYFKGDLREMSAREYGKELDTVKKAVFNSRIYGCRAISDILTYVVELIKEDRLVRATSKLQDIGNLLPAVVYDQRILEIWMQCYPYMITGKNHRAMRKMLVQINNKLQYHVFND